MLGRMTVARVQHPTEYVMKDSPNVTEVLDNDVFEDVEKRNKLEGGKIEKDFIKVGLNFVMDHPDAEKLELNIKQAEKCRYGPVMMQLMMVGELL